MRFVCEGQTRFVFPAEVDKLVAYIDGDVDGEERLETTFDESMTNEFNAAAATIDEMQSRFRNHETIQTQLADMVKNLGKVKSEAEKAQKATETKGLATQKHLQQMVLHASARAEQVQASAALVAQLDHETEERHLRTIERAETSIGCLTIHTPAAASGASAAAASGASAAAASGASVADPVTVGECGSWRNRRGQSDDVFHKEAGLQYVLVKQLDVAFAAMGRTEWWLLGDGPSQVCADGVAPSSQKFMSVFGNSLFVISKLTGESCLPSLCHRYWTNRGATVDCSSSSSIKTSRIHKVKFMATTGCVVAPLR